MGGKKMKAKIQKVYRLVIGTNDENATEKDIDKSAFDVERFGNSFLSGRFHISEEEGTFLALRKQKR